MKKSLFHKITHLRRTISSIGKEQSGTSAIEFAALAPVLILLMFSILEFTLAMSAYIQASEGLRSAARTAAINPAVADLSDLDNAVISCTNNGNVSCPGYSVSNAGAHAAIVAAAQASLSTIEASQISVEYSSSGIGFSRTANGTTPIVTVKLNGYQHPLILQNIIPGVSTINFPDFSTSRTISY